MKDGFEVRVARVDGRERIVGNAGVECVITRRPRPNRITFAESSQSVFAQVPELRCITSRHACAPQIRRGGRGTRARRERHGSQRERASMRKYTHGKAVETAIPHAPPQDANHAQQAFALSLVPMLQVLRRPACTFVFTARSFTVSLVSSKRASGFFTSIFDFMINLVVRSIRPLFAKLQRARIDSGTRTIEPACLRLFTCECNGIALVALSCKGLQ